MKISDGDPDGHVRGDSQGSSHPSPAPGLDRQSIKSQQPRKFICTFEACGKAYTRAEHLHRHQLNHTPKNIYHCNFPGCSRSFVRHDLCVRHRERHEVLENSTNVDKRPRSRASSSADDGTGSSARPVGRPRLSSVKHSKSHSRSEQNFTSHRQVQSHQPINVPPNQPPRNETMIQDNHSIRYDNMLEQDMDHSLFTDANRFPPSVYSDPASYQGVTEEMLAPQRSNSMFAGGMGMSYSTPAFSTEPINESPASNTDDLLASLFGEQGNPQNQNNVFTSNLQSTTGLLYMNQNYVNTPTFSSRYSDAVTMNNTIPSLTPPRDISTVEIADTLLSGRRRLRLITLIETRFHGNNSIIQSLGEQIQSGNQDDPDHVLSLRSMQHYIASYFYQFHSQSPILHQPSFASESTHDYVLLAVMIIGASFLNKAHGRSATDAAAKFASFVAWHLRWQVFMDGDFIPPARLWVFQTLLLLETYEKLNATRALHERAHIHSATSITLMRRGTALIDSAVDVSQSGRNPSTPEEWWYRWINTESTRRAAFSAFIIDATNSIMFGHVATMVFNEVQLPLPCDDALWSATSAAEVGRVEASLNAHNIKPMAFLDALKKTLTGRKVKTNFFGRMILIAGLLSVTWHLNQRDVQTSSLPAAQNLGSHTEWRGPLTRAFDYWKRDFDESFNLLRNTTYNLASMTNGHNVSDFSASADVLHRLAHLAIQIDILDLQIFVGATKLLGRAVTPQDYSRVRYKLQAWAKSANANKAVFHALQMIKSVVVTSPTNKNSRINLHHQSAMDGQSSEIYNARDDHILCRPWVLYYSLLTVWSYGFILDGTCRPFPSYLQRDSSMKPLQQSRSQTHTPTASTSNPPPNLASPSSLPATGHGTLTSPPPLYHSASNPEHSLGSLSGASTTDLRALYDNANAYLTSVGAVKSPDDLSQIHTGRNNLVGLLGLFEISFRDSRWELLHEAADKLKAALNILSGDVTR